MYDKVMYAPLFDPAFTRTSRPRVEGSGRGMIPQFADSGLYEDLQLKKTLEGTTTSWGKEQGIPLIYEKTPTIMKHFSRHNETNSWKALSDLMNRPPWVCPGLVASGPVP
jgi:hypothetical protein